MKIENINGLGIKDCINKLFLNESVVKETVLKNDTQDDIYAELAKLVQNQTELSEINTKIVQKLSVLLFIDKKAYSACKSYSDFQRYLREFYDGLWRNEALRKKERKIVPLKLFLCIIIIYIIFLLIVLSS